MATKRLTSRESRSTTRFVLSAQERIHDYVGKSLRLCGTPLMAFLEELTHGSGWAIVTSSVAVRQPLAEWPHYVAAKCALEGMLHVAACEYPDLSFLIVRPPKLLTDFAPQLGATQSALPPERVAAAVIKRIQGIPNPAQVEVIEDF